MSARSTSKKHWSSTNDPRHKKKPRTRTSPGHAHGKLDWIDWLDEKPPTGFWQEVDRLRMDWEQLQGT